MSISHVLAHIPPVAYPITIGLFANSGVFFGNLGLTLAGPLPIVKDELGESKLSVKDKLRVWTLFFDRAAIFAVGGSLLSAALHLGVIPWLPTSDLKTLSATSAVLSVSILPYTGYAILPVIRNLKAYDKQATLSATEEKDAEQQIRKWDTLHKVRYAMFAPAWAVSLTTLIGVMTV